ncbi:MAG: 2-oxoglutarate dehydrogenase, E2 component, dihydrolipoamide succinyltransferase [Ignavibacteriales bacterium UTCHB2]|jgi:2-oxoglutarate dehydrogenase E2 component (dihydrolipoamide succinyltransferase)|nr:MAG: Dihydrolipoyllysine-residue acetyltransferase component of pyruvate dehydrogenase complex [Ignavibacteria bacterium ADurb.Bin266]OQY71122.1 MAG: 2-oxoglutarate dehydrogenase, E2 component, dihydrolipoamide succinyltransferase [Ignavibacteriales bacterium UTCHB2]HQI39801.1 2-oxoglutarate dehydrogenase, E2 component, dihydrolipoamide succinyltransferase [Ignavibacteriaceae bacterium]
MDIIMPKMGESVNEGTIIKWHKKVGDTVKRDEIIFEISTDKVDTEIPAAESGILSEILVKEGDTVEVGSVVARIKTSDEPDKEIPAPEVKSQTVTQSPPEPVKKTEDIPKEIPSSSKGNLIEIAMPKMGESIVEGTIIKWHKKVGDAVKKDETIFEISTDKVDTEIPSPENGTLAEILVGEQETVGVGTIVAKLAVGADVKIAPKVQQEVSKEKSVIDEPVNLQSSVSETVKKSSEQKGSGSEFYSPLVLSIAQKENISLDELRSIDGTGLEGRVTKKDVLAYLEKRKDMKSQVQVKKEIKAASPAPEFIPSLSPVVYSDADVERIPMDNIRQRIMDHMVLSRDTSVHVTGLIEVDMTRIHNFINTKKDEIMKKENAKLTYMAFIADAVVKSLKKYPLVNSTIDGNVILQKKFINLGIAVAIEPTGLIVPNIKGAGDRNIIGLARAISDLANRSRTKKLTPDDISNGTFTITNYGVFGTIFGTPIINQPEVAILGVGAVQKKPVIIEVDGTDTFAARHIMALTLSHDHRLIDGMLGGLFLKNVKEILENFDGSL